jgi:hypothetical protein
MSTSERARSLLDDDRGAIMVMGIFMCSCLVAALWYLAGIGDAILYRERMQEAADAIAFSDAALHARGMNLIVMINLVMAVILSVRVALRVGKLACTVAAAVFTGLGFVQPELWALAAPAAAAAETLDEVDQASKSVIDGSLEALVLAQDAISIATPGIALSAATAVGDHYAPVVSKHTAYRVSDPFAGLVGGLPVEHARPGKLCDEAAGVLSQLETWLVDKASAGILTPVAKLIGVIMEGLVSLDHKYFCDLEGGASQPSTAGELARGTAERCKDLDKLEPQEQKHFLEAEAAWQKKCAELGVTCQSRDPKNEPLPKGIQIGQPGGPDAKKNRNALERLRLERDESVSSLTSLAERKARAQQAGESFGSKQCEAWALDDAKQRQTDHNDLSKSLGGGGGDNGTSQGTSGIAPMAVKDLRNGSKEGQFIGGVLGDATRLRKDSRLVRLGTFHAKQTPASVDPPNAELPAWAQAEMFYDCAESWTDGACNGGDDAMWHFKWRPRLRRFNQPTDETLQTLAAKLLFAPPRSSPETFAKKLAQDALAPAAGFKSNAALRRDLSNSIQDEATRTHGVH